MIDDFLITEKNYLRILWHTHLPMDKEKLERVEELLLATKLQNERGSMIYSADSTLTKGDFYFLGQNPGGNDEAKYGKDTILNQLLYSAEHNEYLEGEWKGTKGKIHQHNIKRMFEDLELNLKNIFSTNLSFIRSSQTETYSRNLKQDYDIFWPIHEFFLSIVEPKFIIANGAQPRDFFKKKMINISNKEKKEMRSYGKYIHFANSFTGSLITEKLTLENLSVLAIPHLSNVTNNLEDYENYYKDGVEWLKSKI